MHGASRGNPPDRRLKAAHAPPTRPDGLPAHRERSRLLAEEVLVVLFVSFLGSAVFAIIDLFSAPIAGVTRAVFRQDVELAKQIASIVFSLAPVALVLHLIRRSAEPASEFGLGTNRLGPDLGWGLVLGAAVAAAGLGLYLASVRLGLNRFVVPVPPLGHWWTVPVLLLGAARAGLLEEVIVAGYLIRRLEQLGWAGAVAVGASAVLRGAYHLYQGVGGFVGNVALGILFGAIFLRWRRTWPLVVAHFTVDALAGIGYIVFRGQCVAGVCFP